LLESLYAYQLAIFVSESAVKDRLESESHLLFKNLRVGIKQTHFEILAFKFRLSNLDGEQRKYSFQKVNRQIGRFVLKESIV
jgi:lipopolysaccharide/colanic/teichoic acid biosynthesis glycosyltransferase